LTPQDAKMLVDCGFVVTVERSARRVYGDEEYAQVGCNLVDGGSWKDAPLAATILGLQSNFFFRYHGNQMPRFS
jgi:saccharopine dehydrogenase (NAD+, L-lysine-forming)